MIVQRLREIQNRFGFLPDDELKKLARDSGVPLYRIEEVSSFFPAFALARTNPPKVEMRVCRDVTCHHRGAAKLLDKRTGLPVLAEKLSKQTGEQVSVEGVSCLGRCDRAPAVWVEQRPMPDGEHAWVYCNRTQAELETVLRKLAAGEEPPPADPDIAYPPFTNENRPHEPRPVAAGRRPSWPPGGRSTCTAARSGPATTAPSSGSPTTSRTSPARSWPRPARWWARSWKGTSRSSTRSCGS